MCQQVYPPVQPIVCLFVQNLSGTAVSNARFSIDALPGFALAYDCDVKIAADANTVTVAEIPGNTAVAVVCILVIPNFSIHGLKGVLLMIMTMNSSIDGECATLGYRICS